MIGRIVRSADFERVLRTPSRARSAHFAVHFLASVPSQPAKPASRLAKPKLSTGQAADEASAVDVLVLPPPKTSVDGCWLGAVVPKRHARRAVTRTLLKRQIRQWAGAQALPQAAQPLAHGLWVVRLCSPFDRTHFVSAASDALRQAAGDELSAVLAAAARRVGA